MPRKMKRRRKPRRPELSEAQILTWADAHFKRTGRWPNYATGTIRDALGETWIAMESALRKGGRGLPGGSSLARLLHRHRGVRNIMALPKLSVRKIVTWADAHRKRTGDWPNYATGGVPEAPGENWLAIDSSLRKGGRGLPGGSSLARLLAEERGVRNIMDLPRLTYKRILDWADAHHKRSGKWPRHTSGPVLDAPGETWKAVHAALEKGGRGMPGGSSLAQLLMQKRSVRNLMKLGPLTIQQILTWADAHHKRTGKWPKAMSGEIPKTKGETWLGIDSALRKGGRGLKGGSSLYRLLRKHRNIPSRFKDEKR